MDKKHILICEDEIGIREALKLILKDNYEVSTCSNGKECLNLLESEQKFNLLLLKINRSSLDILKNIRERVPELRIIVITDYKNVATATETVKAGAVDYIVKPFSSKEMLRSIKRILGDL